MPPLINSKGQATGAVFGVVNMLKSLIKQYNPSHMAVVFDAKGKTFRSDIYTEYKAHRPPMPDDLRSQIEPLHNIIKAMGFPMIVEPGVEADDVIGTLARQASEKGWFTLISTGDKDMAQLVNDKVTLINTMNNQIMDEEGVANKFGIPPSLIIDYLALMGDKVDNIPGVPKVGEKTALAMLQGIGSIDQIYQDVEKVRTLDFRGAKTMPEKLIEHEDMARLSYKLATIVTDVELEGDLEQYSFNEPDNHALVDLFKEMEFKRWLAEAMSHADGSEADELANEHQQEEQVEKHYHTILTENDLNAWCEKLEKSEIFAFDTETTSLNYMDAKVVGMSFSVSPNEAAYLPIDHSYLEAPEQLGWSVLKDRLIPILESDRIKKVGQNLKYDRSVLLNHDICLRGIAHDTMLQSYVFNSVASRHDMDSLSLKYLGKPTIKFEEIAGKGAKQLTFDQIEVEKASEYAAEDADITLQLHQHLWPKLKDTPELTKVYHEIELPLLSMLSDVERNGVLIDANQLGQQSHSISIRLEELEKQAYELAGEEFNLSSTKQLQVILFEKLSLPVIKKTPKGAPSTAEEVLVELSHDYPLPKLIMEYRGLAKLKSTYTDKLPLLINRSSGRVHTSYHQAVAATGRLSSTDPNLQNIPIRTDEGKKVRKAFIANPGHKILAADYSQIELRIMAHLSGDEGLLNAFANNIDIHKATASEIFSIPLDEVTADHRRSAKAINFGLIYGMSAFGLSRQLGISRQDAQSYMDKYFERYPGVLEYMETTRQSAAENGYVETLMGRRLYLPEINARNGARRKAAERAAINAPMQGTAADIIKLAMIKVHSWLEDKSKDDIRMIMQVHDELVFEVDEEKAAEYGEQISKIMESALNLSVPLLVESGVGDDWEQAH